MWYGDGDVTWGTAMDRSDLADPEALGCTVRRSRAGGEDSLLSSGDIGGPVGLRNGRLDGPCRLLSQVLSCIGMCVEDKLFAVVVVGESGDPIDVPDDG
jgi:hypothetical protein